MRSMNTVAAALLLAVGLLSAHPQAAVAASAAELDRDARAALESLKSSNPTARILAKEARGILVFPHIVKGGFMIGGQVGEGVLLKKGRTAGYYRTVAGSYGLQAGVQKFGYAIFFITQKALDYLDRSEGFEVGVGPSVVVLDEGAAKSVSSTTLTQDAYAFIFDQKGLMGGIGIQGSKITKIDK